MDAARTKSTAAIGADGKSVHEGRAEERHPEERDDNGAAGEHDRASRGVDRVDHRRAGLGTVVKRGAMARHDEQRVVDAHARPIVAAIDGSEARHDEYVAHERHHCVA